MDDEESTDEEGPGTNAPSAADDARDATPAARSPSEDTSRRRDDEDAAPRVTISPPVFFTSGAFLLAFLCFGVFAKEQAVEWFPALQAWVSSTFGWLYVSSTAFFIGLAVWLLFSPYAHIRLGDDDERPEFSRLTWFSMLFSAGMGIGLVFYGVAEPMMHYATPPGLEGGTPEAARRALPTTFLHWGFHGWGVYVLMGLGIGYFGFRRKLPLAIRSCFHPILGERIHGWAGHTIDILAVIGTLFGLATSLGLGAMQVNAGLHHLYGVEKAVDTQLILIGIITLCATISLVTGVEKGIRRLSELNMLMAVVLLIFVFAVGPTLFLVDTFVESIGGYLLVLAERTFVVRGGSAAEAEWVQGWTVFYWGWWIAWCPFVGMFVARVSRGRTIREFILGVLLVPVLVTFVWFTVFGGTALHLEAEVGGIAAAVAANVDTAVYEMLTRLPLGALTCLLATIVVSIFFVTSSDSASFVVDMLTSGGHPDPPIWQRVFWATVEGAVAAVLLFVGGKQALLGMQAMVTSIALPFCVVLLLLSWSLLRGLRDEARGANRHPPLA